MQFKPGQHWDCEVHEPLSGTQVAASIAVGATIDVISGSATVAASPTFLMASLREKSLPVSTGAWSRCLLLSWERADSII